MSSQLKRVAAIGECLLELYPCDDALLHLGFAGDVYNMSAYFAHCVADHATVDFISAVGNDSYSKRMLKAMAQHHVNTQQIRVLDDRLPGLYIIENDDSGERDFYYWRSESAARYTFAGALGDKLLDRLFNYDYVYFTGVILAVLEQQSRDKLLAKLPALQQKGVTICFDPNYRAKLWPSVSAAQQCYELVMPYVDIALPSLADVNALYGEQHSDDCVDRYLHAGAKKVIVTQGAQGYTLATETSRQHYPIKAVQAVDTTGAGDAFNGAFLAAIMCGDDDITAGQKAATLAARVVEHQGAIIF